MFKRKPDQRVQYKQMRLNSKTLYVISQEINSKAANSLTNLIAQYEKKVTSSHLCVVIQGKKGSGKTFVVHETMKQLGIRLLELNVSHSRDLKNVKRVLADAIKNFAVLQKELTSSVVFLDDIDIDLECDLGFQKGVRWLIGESKCPVIMTCTKLPKNINFRDTKVINLESSIDYLQLIYNERDRNQIKLSNTEILYLYKYYEADLNYIFTIFDLFKRLNNFKTDLIPGKVLSSSHCEIEDPLSVLTRFWQKIELIEFEPDVQMPDLVTWNEILSIIDVSEVPLIFLEIVARLFDRHKSRILMKSKGKSRYIDFRSKGVMGNLDDYYSFYTKIVRNKK